MDDVWKSLTDRLKLFKEHWAAYSVVGTALLYLLGYLITRFQLTMLGVGTSLDVLEEQYFYAGARFAVYLLGAALPSLVLILLVTGAAAWIILRILRLAAGPGRSAALAQRWSNSLIWWQNAVRLRSVGLICSVTAIQFIMKQCFLLTNLLLAEAPPEPQWLQELVFDTADFRTSLFFAALLGLSLITVYLFVSAKKWPAVGTFPQILEVLLALLMAVQLLLLPVNYATLITSKFFPRLAPLESLKLQAGQNAWHVWENDKDATLFVANHTNLSRSRALVTIPRKNLEKVEITGYDPLLVKIFRQESSVKNPAAR